MITISYRIKLRDKKIIITTENPYRSHNTINFAVQRPFKKRSTFIKPVHYANLYSRWIISSVIGWLIPISFAMRYVTAKNVQRKHCQLKIKTMDLRNSNFLVGWRHSGFSGFSFWQEYLPTNNIFKRHCRSVRYYFVIDI